MTFFNDVKEIADFSLSHNDFTLIEPLSPQAIQQRELLEAVEVLEQVDFVEEAEFCSAFLDNRFNHDVFEDCSI